MALEVATYIDGLNSSNPDGSSAFKNGDDHLRLIKETIQNTFKNANETYYIGQYIRKKAKALAKTANYTLATAASDTDDGKLVTVDTTAASATITIPAAASAEGYLTFIRKSDSSANTVTIVATGGSLINGAASVVLTEQYSTVGLYCIGTSWVIASDGRVGDDAVAILGFIPIRDVGEEWTWTGLKEAIPERSIIMHGQAISRTVFADLAAVYSLGGGDFLHGNGDGSTTFNVPDTRNRVTVGVGTTTDTNYDGSAGQARAEGDAFGFDDILQDEQQVGPHIHTISIGRQNEIEYAFDRDAYWTGSNLTLTSNENEYDTVQQSMAIAQPSIAHCKCLYTGVAGRDYLGDPV